MSFLVIDGERYKLPTLDDLTFDELCQAEDMGAVIPTDAGTALSPRWVKALIVVAKQRAGEAVNSAAIGQMTFGQITFEQDEAVVDSPPANRAARRANGKKSSGAIVPGGSSTPLRATRAGSGQ